MLRSETNLRGLKVRATEGLWRDEGSISTQKLALVIIGPLVEDTSSSLVNVLILLLEAQNLINIWLSLGAPIGNSLNLKISNEILYKKI